MQERDTKFVNVSNYPDIKELLIEIEKLPHHIAINADEVAKQVKSPYSSNVVMLSASSPFINFP